MRLLFAGTSDIGIRALQALMQQHQLVGLLTQPDRPVGRHQVLTAPATKQLLAKTAPATSVFQPEQLREPVFLEQLRALHPEVIVTFSYGKILPREVLELPSLACLNIHTSLLPRYRGATPIQAAILAGDAETGITIMHMAEGLDTGDILLKKKVMLTSQETTGSLTERLANLAPEAILEALTLLECGAAPSMPQPSEGISHTRQITRVDAIIDPTRSPAELDRLIRAMNPKPGAHGTFYLPSEKLISLKIFSATISASNSSEKPGSLFLSPEKQLFLTCGEGTLQLNEVQPEGRSRMSAAAFISGHF